MLDISSRREWQILVSQAHVYGGAAISVLLAQVGGDEVSSLGGAAKY